MKVKIATLLAVALVPTLSAQNAPSGYLTPPKAIVDIMNAAPLPAVAVSPTGDVIVLMSRNAMPSIEDVSAPMLRLGGLRINPRTNGPHLGGNQTGFTLRTVATGAERPIAVPAGARLGGFQFSPDGKRFSFTNTRDTGIDLYIGDVATAQARISPGAPLNGLTGSCEWLDNSSGLVCGFVPQSRGAAPAEPKVPSGPNIQENSGKPGPVSTYQDMLQSAHDEALFEHFIQNQVTIVDAASGKRTPVGKPGPITGARPSPNGEFFLIVKVKRPYSRLIPYSGFPTDVEVWSKSGQKVRTVADVPMGDTVPINGVITGPRAYQWIPSEPATLLYAEALDNGDLRTKVSHRDRLLTIKAPFTGEPAEVAKTEFRFGGVQVTEKGAILLTENDRASRTTRTWVMTSAWAQPRKLWDRKQQDTYSAPGTPLLRPGTSTILQSGDAIYLTGPGASKEGERPFLDRLNLATLQTERLFRSDDKSYETVVALLSDDAKKVMTRAETSTTPPNYFVRQLPGDTRSAITAFKDPHPQITAAERRFITYQRKDGVGLSGTLYLPPGFTQGQRVPLLVWAYPREFVDAAAASQVVGSPNRFNTVSGASHLLLLAHGYAIFDGPTMPIVGAGETANDTYVDQLVSSAEAAVNKAVELGIADRHRIGVGGHSYGAFMTANLLAHSDLFAAGVARSGAYNRTLTPFGFQSERRTYWEVPETYLRMSPFNFAHKINEPILLIHGEADNNSGTFPIQSERLYMALKGHGATVRYVTLPAESHGYAARESNMHVVAETINWLDKYVKNASPRSTTTSSR